MRAVKGRRQKCNGERILFIGFSYKEKGEEWKGNKWIRAVKGRRQKRNGERILFLVCPRKRWREREREIKGYKK